MIIGEMKMKKLVMLGMVGAMVLGAQSMVFASSTGVNETIKATLTTPAQKVEVTQMTKIVDMAVVTDSMTAEVRELTAEEKALQKERVKEICEAIGMEYDENTTLDEVFMNLTEAQIDELVEKGIIVVATALVPAMGPEGLEQVGQVSEDTVMAVITVPAEKIQE